MKFEKEGLKGKSRNSVELTTPHSDKRVRKGLRRSLIEIKNQNFFKIWILMNRKK